MAVKVKRAGTAGLILTLTLLVVGCAAGVEEDIGSVSAEARAPDPGALIRMQMTSTVGVLLDEIPAGALREAAAAEALSRGAAFWQARAKQQTALTGFRLNWREQWYSADWSSNPNGRGPLPLPPEEIWTITLHSSPRRVVDRLHDMVVVDYTFSTYLLSDRFSPEQVEPALAEIGGTFAEYFSLPTDPELLFQRTGYACMDEDEYPPGSVFEEAVRYFYDDTCGQESPSAQICHYTEFPQHSCVHALKYNTGIVATSMNFQRVAYSATIANSVRVGAQTDSTGSDIEVVPEWMENENAVFYRWFDAGSCEEQEGSVNGLGWRRLLAFSATVKNVGVRDISLGNTTDPANPWNVANNLEYSACHDHYHFSQYGDFFYGTAPGTKQAFCLEDTGRFHNNEQTTLRAKHLVCENMGITPGWGDEYQWGISGQWVDITGMDTRRAANLRFDFNPNGFICEGVPVLDARGNPVFEPTSFTNDEGEIMYRQVCNYSPNYGANNSGSVSVAVGSGSFVNKACARDQIGPRRDCGFTLPSTPRSCTPGATVTLQCSSRGAAQVLRVCEKSAVLGGIPCAYRESEANTIVGSGGTTTVSFTCPEVRDAPGTGGYTMMQAPVLPSSGSATITCTGG